MRAENTEKPKNSEQFLPLLREGQKWVSDKNKKVKESGEERGRQRRDDVTERGRGHKERGGLRRGAEKFAFSCNIVGGDFFTCGQALDEV